MIKKWLVLFVVLAIPQIVCADWESTLQANFDIVETFDNLQDWQPTETGYVSTLSQMPKKADGSGSMWEFYSTDDTAVAPWIRDHGSTYTWRGKSLCINYRNLSVDTPPGQIVGYGPARVSTYFGDGDPAHGYRKVHIFAMQKLHSDTFVRNNEDDGWLYTDGYLKYFEICGGFSAVRTWGTTASRATINACTAGNNYQWLEEYGNMDTVVGLIGGGASTANILCFRQSLFSTGVNTSSDDCEYYNATYNNYTTSNYMDMYVAGEWMAIEYIFDCGTIGNADGSMTVKMYNQNGTLLTTETNTGMQKNTFDYYYNKLTIGGNKAWGSDTDWRGNTYDPSLENRMYWDDIIVNGVMHDGSGSDDDIAPAYFTLLAAYTPTAPVVTAPSNQSIPGTSYVLSGASAVIESGRTVASCTWSSDQGESGSLSTSGTAPNITISGTISGLAQSTEDIVHTITIALTDSEAEQGTDTFTITVQGTGTPSESVQINGAIATGIIIK